MVPKGAILFAVLCWTATSCAPARPIETSRDAQDSLVVTSSAGAGSGSLREAISKANRAGHPVTISFSLPEGESILIDKELPHVSGPGTRIVASGVVISDAGCVRADGREGCSGLTIVGPGVRVEGLTSRGFLFDGISVAGEAATDVAVVDCRCEGNRDDGVGVSAGAKRVLVENCHLTGNGFRTKGKGILVFDHAEAILRNNVVERNRDGITVSRRSSVRLDSNLVTHNFDKGVGVSGATLTGQSNRILGNGTGDGERKAPNGDGLRVSLISHVELHDTVIFDSDDAGVVVLGESRVKLDGGRIDSNGGPGVQVRGNAVLELRGVAVEDNGGGRAVVEEEGRLIESR